MTNAGKHRTIDWAAACALILIAVSPGSAAVDRPDPSGGRNRVSAAAALAPRWNPATGENIRWTADLGSETYGGPVVAGGKVFVGTNNAKPRDATVTGDRGVVMAFRAEDGKFLWQAVHDKLEAGGEVDWPMQGVCSTPWVDGDRLYYVSNRGELVAADTEGFTDSENDGPYKDETRHGPADADIVWILDMPRTLGVRPRRMSATSPLVVGGTVYTHTSNGIGEKGIVPAPAAPSFLAVDRGTGAIRWRSAAPGDRILDGQWSNPSFGIIGGRPQVIFPGGDGWVYAFSPDTGDSLWSFDAGRPVLPPAASGVPAGPRESLIASAVIDADRVYVGIGADPEKGPGKGRLWALRPEGKGDVTAGAALWSLSGDDFSRTLSTVAVNDGFVYAADLRGFVYAIDAATGKIAWSHDLFAAIWGSPLVADGKVFIGDEEGDLVVLKTGPKKELLFEVNMGDSIYTSPAAADGVLYVATRSKLYAIQKK